MRHFGIPGLFTLVLALLGVAHAQSGKLAAIPARMRELENRNLVSGAVTLVVQHGKIVQLSATGRADIASGRPMKTDDLFWIASMTKPMTAVCVMMLAEEGRLALNDPVEKFIPEFRAARLHGAAPPRPITIRDLLTHTGGIGEADIHRMAPLSSRVAAYAHAPMKFAPGTKWDYCNGGFNTLGRVIEVVSGESFATFLHRRLLDPLGMSDTTFWPSPREVATRVPKPYRLNRSTGRLEETSVFSPPGEITNRNRPALPAGGLFSTATDVARFYRMILAGGTVGSRRYLGRETIRQMTSVHTGGLKTGNIPGMSWGLGFQIVRQPTGVTSALSAGSFGHGGSFATQSWADPRRDAIYILMVQRAGLKEEDAFEARTAFQAAAAAALE